MPLVQFNRRRFLSNATLAATASSRIVRALARPHRNQIAFVGIVVQEGSGNSPEQGSIEVYRVNDGQWQFSSSIPAAAPSALAIHPVLPVLYVVHGTREHQHRPRGTVSAFRIHTAEASLTPLSHEPLSLAAIAPDRIAVAPNGAHLAVASNHASIVNLFKLSSDGALMSAPAPIKLPSFSALPFRIAFHPSSSAVLAITSDRVERLGIQPDSSLLREPVTQRCFPQDGVDEQPGILLQQKLAALHAASFALLTL